MEDKIKQLITFREKCWFLNRVCYHPLTDLEIRVSVHNLKLGLGDFKNNGDLFDNPYELGLIYSIPFPGSGWCKLCLKTIKMCADYEQFELNTDDVKEEIKPKREPPYICKYNCGRDFENLDSVASHEAWSRRRGYCAVFRMPERGQFYIPFEVKENV